MEEARRHAEEAKQAEEEKKRLEKELSGLPTPDELKAKVGRAFPQYPIHQPSAPARQPVRAGECAPAGDPALTPLAGPEEGQ